MGNLDKDIYQKKMAIRYCLLTSSLPFLEVNVENKRELSDTATVVTDVDVLGIAIDGNGSINKSIFDCKTLGKTSPINRAFWAAGLMQYLDCDEAFVILRKKASEAHRLSAKHIDVHLFSEKQFVNYAQSYSMDFGLDYCYSTDMSSWQLHSRTFDKNSGFEKFGQFLNGELPLESDAVRGIRRLLAALDKGKGEFNPSKPQHAAIFLHSLMMFSLMMARVIHDFKSIVDYDADKDSFEKILGYYIWGGREAYTKKLKLTELFYSTRTSASQANELELNEWSSFIEMSRKLLDSPRDVYNCCLPLREMSFRSISKVDPSKDEFVVGLFKKNNRLRQFISLQARYLVRAAGLPKEFYENLVDIFKSLQISTTK